MLVISSTSPAPLESWNRKTRLLAEIGSPLTSTVKPPSTWLATFSAIFVAATEVAFVTVIVPDETVTCEASYQGLALEKAEVSSVGSDEPFGGVTPYPEVSPLTLTSVFL